ncbi:hypothetical protein [Orientia tsutsugamushi]|uniref:hypothetical protein n=1 Tax=Orientia tsutsugamushi TaxID=784 RepID=UPI000D5A26BA|nr:integrase [Orientia tsutsugamushi]
MKHGIGFVKRLAGIKNFKIHDLRRTFASCMSDVGAGQYIIHAALNHINFDSTSDYSRVSRELLREYMSKVTQMISGYTKSYNIYSFIQGSLHVPVASVHRTNRVNQLFPLNNHIHNLTLYYVKHYLTLYYVKHFAYFCNNIFLSSYLDCRC